MQKDETKHKDFSHCFEQSAVLALFSVWRIADKGFSFYIPLLTGIGKTSDNDGELETPEVATVSDNNGWWPMAIHGRRRQSWRNGAMAHAEAHWDVPPCAFSSLHFGLFILGESAQMDVRECNESITDLSVFTSFFFFLPRGTLPRLSRLGIFVVSLRRFTWFLFSFSCAIF